MGGSQIKRIAARRLGIHFYTSQSACMALCAASLPVGAENRLFAPSSPSPSILVFCLETVPNYGRTNCCSRVPILIRALYHLAPNLHLISYIYGKTFEMAEGECSRCVFRQEDVDFKNELIQLLSWHLMRQCFMTGALSRVGWIRTLQSEWRCCASMCPEPWTVLPWLYLDPPELLLQ